MFDTLHLTNMLRSEVERIPQTGLPLDAFPEKIREIVLDLSRYENFNVEYTVSIILSAVATAIGNSCHIRIKGEWKTAPSLYMMLVGRPGLGKTPPLGFIYKPINEQDDRMFEKFNEEWNEYEKSVAAGNRQGDTAQLRKPRLVTAVISDFTPEAMISVHQHNPRGIALVVDEILALFNSVKRYSNRNNLIEDLLTAYSGQPLKAVRKSESRPAFIKTPCINIIGSIQTNLLTEIFKADFVANGLTDRFLFVYPKDRKISVWRRNDKNIGRPDILGKWRDILGRVLDIPCIADERSNTVSPLVINMDDEAEEYFYSWYNGIIEDVNAIEDDNEVESRKMKLNGNAARLALIFQIMKWAAGEGEMRSIEPDSVKAAIRMIEYYEESYRRTQEAVVTGSIGDSKDAWLSLLGDTFTSGEAVIAGRKVEMSRRSVYYALEQLCRLKNPVIEKASHGVYRKIISDAACTIALSDADNAVNAAQSAKVQSAGNDNLDSHE